MDLSIVVFKKVVLHVYQNMRGPVVAAPSLTNIKMILTIEFHVVSYEDHQVGVFSFLLGQFIFEFTDFVTFLIVGQLLEHLFGLQNGDGSFHPFDDSADYHFDKIFGDFGIFIDDFKLNFDFSFW